MRVFKTAITISLLSIALSACAHHNSPTLSSLPPETPAALVLTDEPSADLQVCAERPMGFSKEAWADMNAATKATLDEIALSAGRNAARLDRWVNLHTPDTCALVE